MDQATVRPKILCVDDTPEVCTLVQRLLSHRYDVAGANDGLQGIEIAVDIRPDLVLLDMHMPGLTGYEVATRLKSLMPGVPVVALTADVTADIRKRVLAAGCDGYLAKPVDPDGLEDQVQAFLDGAREELKDDSYRQDYQQTLVVRLEDKVRELTRTLERNAELDAQNIQLLEQAQRQARLLAAGAKVGRSIVSILDLDALLNTTVDMICDEFGFYYAGVFLIDEMGEWAVLRAGRGEAGGAMIAKEHKLKVGGLSMIGTCITQRQARIALDVGEEPVHFKNPHLPHTRSEMALALVVGNEVIGALTVQSVEEAAFGDEDATALQAMADQLAVAINNAQLLKELETAHEELVRAKTFEAIATATGEAIHWVGNKAAPIPGSVARITEDFVRYMALANALVPQLPLELREQKFAQLLADAAEVIAERGNFLKDVQADLESCSLKRLRNILSVESIFEDLEIIQSSARAILNIKEDLIGPARKRKDQVISVADLLMETIASMGISDDVARTLFSEGLPCVRADPSQLERVFINLIKNSMEAMVGVEDKRLFIWGREADEPGFIMVDVTDNGHGIPPEIADKIWVAFYTTKGDRGGTGLGLAACAQIVGQLGGRISMESEVGVGTTFSVLLPVAAKEDVEAVAKT